MAPRESAQLDLEIRNLGPLAKVLEKEMPDAFNRGMRAGIRAATIHLSASVKNLLEGPVLQRQTGTLWRSIQPEVYTRGGTVVGIVGTDKIYAPVHEFGATIRPKSADGWLRFKVNGKWVTTKKVEIPRRPYMSRAFREEKTKATGLIREQVMREAAETFGQAAPSSREILPVSQRVGVRARGL